MEEQNHDAQNEPLANPGIQQDPDWKTNWRRLTTFCWADFKAVLSETFNNWYSHNVPRLGASLAFYTLLSLAPLLLIVIAVAGAVFGREAAEGQLVWQIQDLIGRAGAELVQSLLQSAQMPGARTLASLIGLVTLMYGATAVVAELRDALNTIWCVPRREESTLRSIVSLLRDRTVAFAAVLGIGFLLLVSLAINAALSAMADRYDSWLPSPQIILQSVNFVVSYVVITVLFALMYKLLPDLYLEWRDVIPGALVTSLLFSTGKTLIGMYLGKATVASAYGAAGSLVVVLFWVYYSAQIFFLGAEFTQVYAQRYGSRPCDRIGKEVQLASTLSDIEPRPDTPEDERIIRVS
jgi:membrane protein